jgi:hypothetical protein
MIKKLLMQEGQQKNFSSFFITGLIHANPENSLEVIQLKNKA